MPWPATPLLIIEFNWTSDLATTSCTHLLQQPAVAGSRRKGRICRRAWWRLIDLEKRPRAMITDRLHVPCNINVTPCSCTMYDVQDYHSSTRRCTFNCRSRQARDDQVDDAMSLYWEQKHWRLIDRYKDKTTTCSIQRSTPGWPTSHAWHAIRRQDRPR